MQNKPKKFEFVNEGAKRAFLDLPIDVKKQFGSDLNAIQQREDPYSPCKPLKSIGAGVIELIENGSPAYRAVYCAKYLDTVYVLHAFTKTTNGVDSAAMETVELRYKEMMAKIEQQKRGLKPH